MFGINKENSSDVIGGLLGAAAMYIVGTNVLDVTHSLVLLGFGMLSGGAFLAMIVRAALDFSYKTQNNMPELQRSNAIQSVAAAPGVHLRRSSFEEIPFDV